MSESRRVFSKEFKLQVLDEADDGVPMVELCRRYKLSRTTIWKWREKLKKAPEDPFPGKGSRASSESKKIAEMGLQLRGRCFPIVPNLTKPLLAHILIPCQGNQESMLRASYIM